MKERIVKRKTEDKNDKERKRRKGRERTQKLIRGG